MAALTPKEAPTSERKRSRLEALERRLKGNSPLGAYVIPSSSPLGVSSPRTKDVEPVDPTYSKLCPSLLNGPLAAHLQLQTVNDSKAAIFQFLQTLLESNPKFGTNAGSIIDSRLQHTSTLLLDNPASQSGAERAQKRAQQNRAKRSHSHLSLRKHRQLGSFDLPQEFQQYSMYSPLHEMWKNYAKNLTSSCGDTMAQSRLMTADLHGAILAVIDSKNWSYIGLQGIVLRETENTFGIISSKDKFHVVPKVGTIFRFQLEDLEITLFGNNLALRSVKSEIQKKHKLKLTIEI